MPFTIKDVNCEFLMTCTSLSPSLLGDRRLFDLSRGIGNALRGQTYAHRATLPDIIPGIVVGYETTASPELTSPVDSARYLASQRPNFEVFNFVYKVYQPSLYGTSDGALLPEDFEEDTDGANFSRKLGFMRRIVVSLSANQIQGAIPPGAFVKVQYENIQTLKNPQIIEIGEKIFDIAFAQNPPPGNIFLLGGPQGPATSTSSDTPATTRPPTRTVSSYPSHITDAAPNNPNVRAEDEGPIIGLGKYSKDARAANITILEKHMKEKGITNRYLKIAILGVVSKESGLIPKSEYGWSRSAESPSGRQRARDVFGARVAHFSDAELRVIMSDDREWFGHIYGPKYFGPGTRGSWAKHIEKYDGYDYRGRGFNQITFKASYEKYGNLIGVDLVASPDLLNDPDIAAKAAVAFLVQGIKHRSSPIKNDINDISSQRDANIVVARANAGWGKPITNRSVVNAISHTNKASKNFV